jgi:hypothetical protein
MKSGSEKMEDFINFVEKSMIKDEIDRQIISIKHEIHMLEVLCKTKEESLKFIRTPLDIIKNSPAEINWRGLSRNSNPDAIKILEKTFDKIEWEELSSNPSAVHILENNPQNIYWNELSSNPNAIHILENNITKICWENLSRNPSAIHILEKYPQNICWENLSRNPNAIHILENNIDKVSWYYLSEKCRV